MRTTGDEAGVRLYYLNDQDAIAHTLFYGPLSDALRVAGEQPADLQDKLWLATENDVVAYLDLIGG